jgi:Tropinone reductase 1
MSTRWSLQGKRALVTGGTRGIGHATAESLIELGANVIVVGRDEERANELRAAWKRDDKAGMVVTADVTTVEGRAHVVDAIRRGGSQLDVNSTCS